MNYFRHLLNVVDLNQSGKQQSIRSLFEATLSITEICIDCGKVSSRSETAQTMTLTNETEAHQFSKTVRLQVIYIFEYAQAKKYELLLHPGEYSYHEVIQMIREKVQ